jgi:hypothetical protein
MDLPEMEAVAELVHEEWRARKAAEGTMTRPHPRTGDEQMLPWSQVSETVKNDNRSVVKVVYDAIEAVQRETFDTLTRPSTR